ncbi:hypothetical protein JYU34_003092 [Plutella xylostella]|uniref:SHSP domain-containing protein n=1 Tax=Plutella xylostella TaxID=51655 RepID=A0ABQ7QZ50_PLUXY|nr:hypothetical protein JYU34_003092 [Plutella xylostella]
MTIHAKRYECYRTAGGGSMRHTIIMVSHIWCDKGRDCSRVDSLCAASAWSVCVPRAPRPAVYSLPRAPLPQSHSTHERTRTMLSSRTLLTLALGLAVAAAVPVDKSTIDVSDKPALRPITTIEADDGDEGTWFSFPLFGNFGSFGNLGSLFTPIWKLFPNFADLGPRINSDENKFDIIVNVKEYKKDELKVKVKGFLIIVQGIHEAKTDSDIFDRQFFHTYTLPVNASGTDVTADLFNNGFLVVSCPLNGKSDKDEEVNRDVEIKETGTAYELENKTTVGSSQPEGTKAPVEVSTAGLVENEDDRKEPTTPSSERELAKNNIIPHGQTNEALP